MSTSQARSSNNGEFALCIEGLPSSYTWQDVKDLARNRAEHGIRADVAHKTGPNGEQIPVHVAKVTRRNEANNLYEWLVSTRIEQCQLRIHFFEGSQCTKTNCQLPDRHCSVCSTRPRQVQPPITPYYPGPLPVQPIGYPPQGLAYSSPRYPPGPGYNGMAPQYHAPPLQPQPPSALVDQRQQIEDALRAHAASGKILNGSQEEFLRQMAAMRLTQGPSPYMTTNAPPLAAAASGAPINTAYGYARTEIRGVFVSGLDFKTRSQDVEDLFAKAGTIIRCQLHTDNRGNGRGTATIEFSTATEASQAVSALNNFPWRGRTLRVRSDREAVVVRAPIIPSSASTTSRQHPTECGEPQEPTIVDGSNSRQVRE